MSENNENKKEKKDKPGKCAKWFKHMRGFYKCFLRLIFPVKKYGHTEVFTDREYILTGNHLSVMDVIPLAISTDRPVHYMAKNALFEKGFMKWFTKKCECIPVNRDGGDVKAVMQAMRYLKAGECIGIFPEGTRNKTSDMFLPFRGGTAAISIKTKTPIVPFIQVTKMRAFHRVNVFVGEPFEFDAYYDKRLTQQDMDDCDELLRQRFEKLYVEFKEFLESKKKKKKSKK